VQKYFEKAKSVLFSATAKDTYILFLGNIDSAFLGFLFTYFIAGALGREDFGIFSATLNLVVILSSLSDIGITSGLVNFIAEADSDGNEKKSLEFQKAGLLIRVALVVLLSVLVIIFAPFISKSMLATTDPVVAIWASVLSLFLFVPMYFPFVLQAKKQFLKSVVIDNIYYFFRLIGLLGFIYFGTISLYSAFSTALIGFIVSLVASFMFLKFKFLYSKPKKDVYTKLLKFSGWIGVNRIISSISGRLDIQMLASISGASVTALYSIPARLSSFIVILTSSFSAVLAPRFAGFGDKNLEKKYLVKSTFALIPIIIATVAWVIVAKPFMAIIFPNYLDSVPVFQALTLSMIPFILTAPSVAAIIYAMKKNIYIGAYSFFQIVAIFLLNYYFIPKYGAIGPTITYGITNTILAIYTWVIVIKYYWYEDN
jgi:O-antigen/teichoic acid export membrane protein